MNQTDAPRGPAPISRRGWWLIPLVVAAAAGAAGYQAGRPAAEPQGPAAAPHAPHRVVIRDPGGPPTIDTGLVDAHGNPVGANCSTCHATRAPNPAAADGEQLHDFHTGLHTDHGGRTCLSCHNANDYTTLALADGRTIPFTDQMQLCAQCHGPQHRDYVNGSHGGMNGYWDLTRGGRTRNTCTNCHDAHAPQYPTVMPVFKPTDRFLGPPIEHQGPAAGLTGAAHESETPHD